MVTDDNNRYSERKDYEFFIYDFAEDYSERLTIKEMYSIAIAVAKKVNNKTFLYDVVSKVRLVCEGTSESLEDGILVKKVRRATSEDVNRIAMNLYKATADYEKKYVSTMLELIASARADHKYKALKKLYSKAEEIL